MRITTAARAMALVMIPAARIFGTIVKVSANRSSPAGGSARSVHCHLMISQWVSESSDVSNVGFSETKGIKLTYDACHVLWRRYGDLHFEELSGIKQLETRGSTARHIYQREMA